MRITLGKNNFNNIKDFTTYLETTYEQDKPDSGVVRLFLECDEFSQENLNELVEFLLKPERTRLYKFDFPPQQNQYQLAFDEAYVACKRGKLSLEFRQQIAELASPSISFQPHVNKIRKTKKNWIEGTKGPGIGLQLQYQLQPQKEQPQQKPQKATQRKRKEELAVGAVVEVEKIRSEDLGELVDRTSLSSKKWLDFAKRELDPEIQSILDKQLLVIWDRLVGKGVNQVRELDRKITHVQAAAMERIIQNFHEFSYGLIFDDLPAGFYLQQTQDGKNVLCFSKEPQYQHLEQITPLTLVPELPQENDFIFSLSELTENDAEKMLQIKRLLQTIPLSVINFQSLDHVLIHTGADGVLLLLQQLKTLHDKDFFKDFNEMFLDKPENYLALMSPQGFANLKKLSELSGEQRVWWNSIVAQHKASGARTEFNELFAAYDYFLNQLEKKKLKLPLSCALKNIRHMKPALARLLFIINNSSDPEEQLTCLDGLDFDVYGAYYASRYCNYKLVSRHMNLKPNINEEALDFTLPLMPNDINVWLTRDLSYKEIVTRFYRLVGQQEWAFSLDVYQKIEREISNNLQLNKQNKALLLHIVALVTTGQHACTQLEDPYSQVKNLLNKFITLAGNFNEDLKHQLSTVLPVCAEALEHCSWESMPTADELNKLIDILLPVPPVAEQARHDFLVESALALNLIGKYNNAASSVIDNYKKRFAVEQSNTVPIKKFSFSILLKHLVSPSKLDKFLPDQFHDQLELLSQFIVLLSLFSDEISEVTRHDEADSEFETKIKTLAQAMHGMQAERRGQLLSILVDINIEASYRLPSLEQLIKTVDLVTKAEEKLGALPSVENQKAGILEIVHTELPDLKIGKNPVNEAAINFISLMRKSYEEWQLENKLENLPEKLKGHLEYWIDAHRMVLHYLNRQPINPRMVFESLAQEEQEVKNLLVSRWFAWTLSGFPQEKIQMTQILGNEFFTNKSFIAVLKPRMEAACQSSLSATLKSLQTSNKDFDAFLLNQIRELNTDLPIDEALLELSQQLDLVNGLINTLIRIKNQNNIDFQRCIALLTDEMKSPASGKISLTATQMKDLLDTLGYEKTCSVSSPLAILFKILKEIPEYSAEQLRNALSEVTYLTKNRDILGEEAYEALLRFSCTHNLTQKSLFPLKEIIGLKSLTDVNEKHSKDLFDALIHTVKKASPDVDAQLLKKVIDKTTSIIQTKASVPSLVPLLTLLMKTCSKASKDELIRYCNIVDKLENTEDSDLNPWVKILIVLGERATDENIHRLWDVQAGLELNQSYLQELAQLFEYPPYPAIEPIIEVLNGYFKDLKLYVDTFDKDPKSGRAPQKNAFNVILKDSDQVLDEQFDSSQVGRVIGEIKNITEGTSLSSQEQYDLAQQIIYINAIGRDKPLTLVVGNDPTTKQIKVYKDLTQVSRDELRELSDTLIAAIRKPDLEVHEKLKAQLRLLAVLREQYSRATGKFVDTTQLIAILMSLKNQQNNMLMEIDTEEGNRITTALLTVMQWVEADGGTVDVCAPNLDSMVQDYKENAKDFFTSLGIASSCIEVGSPNGSYQVGGINYSTLGDLALYRSRAKTENENLTAYKDSHPLSSNLILYGSDFSELDERTLFNLTIRAEGDEGSENNPYAWIFPLVNEFIDQEQFKIQNLSKGWSEEQDVDQLKAFLYSNAPTGLHKAQLSALPKNKFNLWINSAIAAQRFVEGEDFVIAPSKTAQHFAIPLNQKIPQGSLTFMEHQFLHARLQMEYPDWEFVITPEMHCVDSVSLKDFIDEYKKQGRIISVSRGIDKKDGLVEHCGQFGMNIACKIPPHQKNKHEELVTKSSVKKEEDHETFFSQFWCYRSKTDRKKMLAELAELQRLQREGAVVEGHYLQTISSIQQVVLHQFQEWKEFLHLVYPKSEWRTLDAELLSQREDLILSLNEQWDKCLEQSDPQQAYPNPYVRPNANKKLQTLDLDDAVAAYEVAISSIWDQQRAFLKEKAKPVIVENSVNALRCHYLDGVSLSEQLQLNRLADLENKKEMLAEKKKVRRYVESGLEVNGAMLRFADGDVEVYRDAFAKSQVKLFATDISQMIKNNPYLNKTVRSILVDQVMKAPNLDILVSLLVDYADLYLPEDQFTEKYAMQPIIQELLRIYQQAGLEETNELQKLKTVYFDQVAAEIVDDLETTLSWAMEGNRGLGYLLERSAVTAAADAILNATHKLKEAETLPARQMAIKNLYQVLAKHEAQLEGLWIFSWGHKNTRTLIKETLATLDGLTAIGSGTNELDADFIHDCKEESLYAVMKGKLDSAIQVMEEEKTGLQKNEEWNAIKNALTGLQTENNTIYAFHEMYYFLSNKVGELASNSSKLQEPVTRLRGEVRNLCESFRQDHKELLNKSKYLTRKAENLKEKLKGLNGFNVEQVKFKEGHNGFSDYFDLVIKGSGSHPLFHDFTQYNSRAQELTKEREALELRLIQTNEQFSTLDRLIKEQLPLLKLGEKTKASVEQFPEQFQDQVNEILVSKGWVTEQLPGDLSSFPEDVRNNFLDRELIKTFKFPDLQADEIDKIQDIVTKIEFRDLHERMVEGIKPKTMLGNISSYLSSYLFTPENMEDWSADFYELVNRPTRNLQQALCPNMEKKQKILADQIDKLRQQTVEQIESLKQQVAFLNDKIDEEEKREGLYVMRITNTAELFKFEKELMAVKTHQKPTLPPRTVQEPNVLPKTVHPQVSIGISDSVKETATFVM